MKLIKKELKEYLDQKYLYYNRPEFILDDPIQIPHSFSTKEDIEISSFLMATIAWGNRRSILKNGEKLMQLMSYSPYEFVQNYNGEKLPFVHRTFNAEDLQFFLQALHNCYVKNGGLETLFELNEGEFGVKQRIINFRTKFLATSHPSRSEKHVSNPEKGSAAKRLNMFLRWMVRNDGRGVDFGIWKNISPAQLYLPLDVHTGNIARQLGILKRKQNDWTALEEVQKILIEFDANDPVKYDFALFGIGANHELD